MITVKLASTICFILLAPALSGLHAQESKSFYDQPFKERNNGTFNKGTHILTFGYGLGNTSGTGYLNVNYNERISHTNVGPLYVKYEYGLVESIGLGVYGSYAYAKDVMNPDAPKDYFTHAASFGINGFYHFNKVVHVENLDLYAGLGLGFKVLSIKSEASDGTTIPEKITDNTGVFSIRLGARYYIVNGFGAYFEFGPDKMSALNVGLSYRF